MEFSIIDFFFEPFPINLIFYGMQLKGITLVQATLFQVYLGDSAYGPWTRVVYSTLPDPRKTDRRISSVPAYSYSISPRCAQYVRFRIVSWYGSGGGLQYFSTCPLGISSLDYKYRIIPIIFISFHYEIFLKLKQWPMVLYFHSKTCFQ